MDDCRFQLAFLYSQLLVIAHMLQFKHTVLSCMLTNIGGVMKAQKIILLCLVLFQFELITSQGKCVDVGDYVKHA